MIIIKVDNLYKKCNFYIFILSIILRVLVLSSPHFKVYFLLPQNKANQDEPLSLEISLYIRASSSFHITLFYKKPFYVKPNTRQPKI